ncbi:hypothetical protein C900_05260 [Fulvivirga imtechensis AK7]|uniref:HEAT repeat domain-containing protein n=1 Tax=Fulvivirga imtechensis AK7 TaxID=1237149 RepID=L8JVY9_9BACT|nr:hypothetical protein C900_05260 [Fulvivirga imtechensis AK7]
MSAADQVAGQSSVDMLDAYMLDIREGSLQAVPREIITDQQNASALINALEQYYSDSVVSVRAMAYDLSKRIALGSDNNSVRQEVVGVLISALRDKDSGVIGRVATGLTYFQKDDFTPASTNSLTALPDPKQPHLDKVIMLTGFVGGPNDMDVLRNLANQSIGRNAKWSAYLVMARLGDEGALIRVLNSVKSRSLNDDVVEELPTVPEIL